MLGQSGVKQLRTRHLASMCRCPEDITLQFSGWKDRQAHARTHAHTHAHTHTRTKEILLRLLDKVATSISTCLGNRAQCRSITKSILYSLRVQASPARPRAAAYGWRPRVESPAVTDHNFPPLVLQFFINRACCATFTQLWVYGTWQRILPHFVLYCIIFNGEYERP